jgi:hypothetical protein
MFGLFSLSTFALMGLYAWGFVMMWKAGMNAGKSWWAAASWAAVWPLSMWKLMNDLWRSEPPVE